MNLKFTNVSLRLKGFALELNLTLDKQVTALFGPSGSGKTSVLELVAGLRRADQGAIELDGLALTDVSQGISFRRASGRLAMCHKISRSFRI